MKNYELINKLSQFPPDMEVKIFTMSENDSLEDVSDFDVFYNRYNNYINLS